MIVECRAACTVRVRPSGDTPGTSSPRLSCCRQILPSRARLCILIVATAWFEELQVTCRS